MSNIIQTQKNRQIQSLMTYSPLILITILIVHIIIIIILVILGQMVYFNFDITNRMTENILHQQKQVNAVFNKSKDSEFSFVGFIKRESRMFSSWKPRLFRISHAPNNELFMTILDKGKSIQEIINLVFSKLSTKCSKVDKFNCFGLIVPSGKKYMVACADEKESQDIFQKILAARNQAKKNDQMDWGVEIVDRICSQKSIKNSQSNIQHKIQWQQHHESLALEEKQNNIDLCSKIASTNAQSKKQSDLSEQIWIPQAEKSGQDQVFVTMIKIQESQSQNLQQISPLTMPHPLMEQQQCYLQSDEGFKLLMNLCQGRILTKNKQIVKASLLAYTHLSSQNLLQSFFHLQLWNDKIKSFKIINRIDKGIYLIYLEFERLGFISLPKYTYLMVSTWSSKSSHLLIMRSMDQNHFQKQRMMNYINLSLCVRIKDTADNQKLMTICCAVKQDDDFSTALAFIKQIKVYQIFLKTTIKPAFPFLEWREGRSSFTFDE